MEEKKLQSILESVLFVSGEPIKLGKLTKICQVGAEEIEGILEKISTRLNEEESGLSLLRNKDAVQMVTKPENVEYVEQLVKNELADSLSPAALEVVSIIAYRGPISKAEIEAIRGVNCSYTVRNLLMRGLIIRSDNPRDSRGYIYEISFEFLKKMGIDDVKKLPEYAILSKDERINSIIA
jgi:segregation and condensation protein B